MGPPKFRDKAIALIIFWIMAAATYAFIPKLLFLEPDTTPFYHFDKTIPFLSWTVAIYLTLYAQVTLMFLLVKNREVLKRLFWAYMVAGAVLSIFYFLLPTTHNYPTPVVHCNNCFDHVVLWLKRTDIPANQFPSGHATFSLLGPFLFLSAGRYKKGAIFLLWGILITISTLTVKQHNLVDVVAGAMGAMAFGYLFGESCPRTDELTNPT